MKNYEFYKDKLCTEDIICASAFICRHGKNCEDIECSNCAFNENLDLSFHVLLAEHKEPVKLKRWEYDLIRTNDMSHSRAFGSFNTYLSMKKCGYFSGVKDTSMALKEILENYEVIDD